MKPEGILIAIGGNEERHSWIDEQGRGSILKNIIIHSGGPKSRIELITCATEFDGDAGNEYAGAFRKLGALNVGSMVIESRKTADSTAILKRLEQADAILFTGGNQGLATELLRSTKAHELLYSRFLDEKLVIAGTSEGAVVLTGEMIVGGEDGGIIKKGNLKMEEGFGFTKQIIFESHFFVRNRFGRLAEAVALNPGLLGIGIGEDTGVIIKEGNICEVIGNGMVIILDGSELGHNYYLGLEQNNLVSLVGLKVHLLAPKDKYFIEEKEAEIYIKKKASQEVTM